MHYAYGLLNYVRPLKLSIIQTGNDAMHFDGACALCIRVRIHLWFQFKLHNKAQLKPHCYHSSHSQLMDLGVFMCVVGTCEFVQDRLSILYPSGIGYQAPNIATVSKH